MTNLTSRTRHAGGRLRRSWQRVRTVPGLARDAVALLVVVALGLTSAVVILSQLNFSVPWSDRAIVRVEVAQAVAVSPGNSQEVRIAGVPVGLITRSEPTDRGTSVLTLEIDRGHPVYDNARAVLRPVNPLNQMYVTLNPGGPPGKLLEDGGLIPVTQTERPIQAEEVLNKLDDRSRVALASLLAESDNALANASETLPGALDAASRTLKNLQPVVDKLQHRQDNIRKLVAAVSDVSTALGANDQRLTSLVNSTQQTLTVLQERDAELRRSLQELPGTTGALRDTLASLSGLSGELDPTLDSVKNASSDLPDALSSLTDAAGPLREVAQKAGPVVEKAGPVVSGLRPIVDDLHGAVVDLKPVTHCLDDVTSKVAPWMYDLGGFIYNTNSLFSVSDPSGGLGRGHVVIDPNSPTGTEAPNQDKTNLYQQGGSPLGEYPADRERNMSVSKPAGTGAPLRLATVIAFVLACLVFFGYLWAQAGGSVPGFSSERGYSISFETENVVNVVPFTDVQVAGVPVGKVDSITRVQGRVRLDLSLEPVAAPLHQGAKVQITEKSLAGQPAVRLIDGTGPELESGSVLPAEAVMPAVTLRDVLASLDPKTLDSLGGTVRSLAQGTDGRSQDISATLAGLADLGRNGGTAVDAIAAQSADLEKLAGEITTVSDALDTGEGHIADLVENANTLMGATAGQQQNLAESVRKLGGVANGATVAAGQLTKISSSLAPVAADLRAAAPDLNQALLQLPGASADLRGLMPPLQSVLDQAPATLDRVPAFGTTVRNLIPPATEMLRDLNPALRYLKPYDREIAQLLPNFGSGFHHYDNKGAYVYLRPTLEPGSIKPNPVELPNIPGIAQKNPYPQPGGLADLRPFDGTFPHVERDGE